MNRRRSEVVVGEGVEVYVTLETDGYDQIVTVREENDDQVVGAFIVEDDGSLRALQPGAERFREEAEAFCQSQKTSRRRSASRRRKVSGAPDLRDSDGMSLAPGVKYVDGEGDTFEVKDDGLQFSTGDFLPFDEDVDWDSFMANPPRELYGQGYVGQPYPDGSFNQPTYSRKRVSRRRKASSLRRRAQMRRRQAAARDEFEGWLNSQGTSWDEVGKDEDSLLDLVDDFQNSSSGHNYVDIGMLSDWASGEDSSDANRDAFESWLNSQGESLDTISNDEDTLLDLMDEWDANANNGEGYYVDLDSLTEWTKRSSRKRANTKRRAQMRRRQAAPVPDWAVDINGEKPFLSRRKRATMKRRAYLNPNDLNDQAFAVAEFDNNPEFNKWLYANYENEDIQLMSDSDLVECYNEFKQDVLPYVDPDPGPKWSRREHSNARRRANMRRRANDGGVWMDVEETFGIGPEEEAIGVVPGAVFLDSPDSENIVFMNPDGSWKEVSMSGAGYHSILEGEGGAREAEESFLGKSSGRRANRTRRDTMRQSRARMAAARRRANTRRRAAIEWSDGDGNELSGLTPDGPGYNIYKGVNGYMLEVYDLGQGLDDVVGPFNSEEEAMGAAENGGRTSRRRVNTRRRPMSARARRRFANDMPTNDEQARRPDDQVDVEQEIETSDPEAESSQYDPAKFEDNAGEDLKVENNETSPEGWVVNSARRHYLARANHVEAMSLADKLVDMGLAEKGKKMDIFESLSKKSSVAVREQIGLLDLVEKKIASAPQENVEKEEKEGNRRAFASRGPRPSLSSASKKTASGDEDFVLFL